MGFMSRNEHDQVHCSACGTESYDNTYSLGYQVNHGDWSPYPRVNHLRKTFLDRQYDVDVERLRLVTEAYKKYDNCTIKIKCARAFENILDNVTLEIYDEDLVLGEIAAPAKASPIYPEFSVSWIINEVLNEPFEEREHDQFYIRSDEERKEIVELCRYWEGKTVDDLINAGLDEDQLKGSEAGKKIFQANLYHYAGVGHLVMDYAKLMITGFNGLIEEAETNLSKLTKRDPDYADKRDFYEAMIISLKASIRYIQRYGALADERASAEADPQRKKELEVMAENCRQIAGGPAKNFWQAIQLFNFATTLTQIEGNGHSISYGRMDQWLYPYYEADIKAGTLTKDFALELI